MAATSLELDSQTRKKRRRKEQIKKLLVGASVEVRSTEDGFHGSWHAATVIDSSSDLIRRVKYHHLLADNGIDILNEDIHVSSMIDGFVPTGGVVPVNHRGVMRPLPPSFEFDIWGLNYGLCVDAYVEEAWWEGVIFDHEDGCDERLVFFPDLGDDQKVKIEHLRVTYDWDEVSEEWMMRGDWLFLELIEEHEVDLFVSVSVRQLWYDLRAKKGFKTKIKEWMCWVRPVWDKLVLEVIRDNINLTATHFLTVMECEGVVKAIDIPNRKTRSSGSTYDTALPSEDILEDCVDKNLVVPSSCPSGRTRSSSCKSDLALFCGDLLCDVEGNQVLKARDIGYNDDTALQRNGTRNVFVNTTLVAYSVGPSGRTGSSSCKYDFALPSGDVLQDAEENRVLMTPPEEKSLKRKADSFGTLYENNNTKGSSEVKFGSQVDKNASLKFRIVKDCKGNLGTLPINTNNGDLDSSDDLLENGNCDPENVTLSEVDLDPNPICASGQSDPNLYMQISSVTDDRGDQVGKFFIVALNYLNKSRKQFRDDVMMHLSDMGWKIEKYHDSSMIKRVRITSPEGQKYYSLTEVCKLLTDAKENTRTKSSHIVNSGLMNSSIMSMDSSIEQVPFLDVLQHCGRDSSIVCKKAMALDHIKMETAASRSVSPFTEPLYRGRSSMKGTLAHAGPVVFIEPEYCLEAVVELYGLGPVPNFTKRAKDLREKAMRHLSYMGWKFRYVEKKERLELLYTSPPPNSRDYFSLRTACKACILPEHAMPVQRTMKDKEYKGELACVNLSSAVVCAEVEEHPVSVYVQSGNSCIDISGSSQSSEFQLSNVEANRRRRTPRRRKKNAFPFTLNLGSDVSASGSDTRPDSTSLAVFCSKKQGQTLCQNSNYQEQKKCKIVRASMHKGDDLDGSCPSRTLRSHKRARQVVAPNPAHFTPRTILTWLIDNNVVLPREKVFYGRNNQRSFEGKITRDGIKCNCCQKVFGISGFEAHTGSTKRKAAANIFLEDGRSLLDCQKEMIQSGKLAGCTPLSYHRIKSNRRQVRNDSICSVCHYGGILVLCDQCPSSYHLNCIGLESLPKGKWFCPSCRCGICGQSDYNGNVDQFTDKTVLFCDQCEREYHVGCLRKKRMVKLDGCPEGIWFCSKICEKIFLGLYRLSGKSIAVGIDNLSWTILKFSKDGYDKDAITVHSKLNVALAVMHECFEPIKEPQTKDLVKDVLFNKRSVLKRLDFQGFYTVLLEREDELISVATVRVYGGKVAEVPLVGTRVQYRRQGMCRILMDLLEKKLAEFGVERLLLPAIPQVLHAWTTSFGFSKMTESERLEYLEYTFLDFQDTTMCQKLLKTVPTSEVKGPRAKQHRAKIVLNLSNADVFLDKGDIVPEVTKQEEPSNASTEIPVKHSTCNDCSPHDMVSAVTVPSNMLWNKYENRSTESDGKQREDNKCSKSKVLLTYFRRKYRHRLHP